MFFVLLARSSLYWSRIHIQGPTRTDCRGIRILNPYFAALTSKNKCNIYSTTAHFTLFGVNVPNFFPLDFFFRIKQALIPYLYPRLRDGNNRFAARTV